MIGRFNKGDIVRLIANIGFYDISMDNIYEILNCDYSSISIITNKGIIASYSAKYFELDKETMRHKKINTLIEQLD